MQSNSTGQTGEKTRPHSCGEGVVNMGLGPRSSNMWMKAPSICRLVGGSEREVSQTPASSDLTPTLPDKGIAAYVCSVFTNEPGQKAVSAWSAVGAQDKGLWSPLKGRKELLSTSSPLGCVPLWRLPPPFPPGFLVARRRGRPSRVRGTVLPCSPSPLSGGVHTGSVSAHGQTAV